jgi:hypothetical protein
VAKVPLAATKPVPPPEPGGVASSSRVLIGAVIHRARATTAENVFRVYELDDDYRLSHNARVRTMAVVAADLGAEILRPAIAAADDGRVYSAWIARTKDGAEKLMVRRTAPQFGDKEAPFEVPLPAGYSTVKDLDLSAPPGCSGIDIVARIARPTGGGLALFRTHVTFGAC